MSKIIKISIFLVVLAIVMILFIYVDNNIFSDDEEMSDLSGISVLDDGVLLTSKFYDDIRFKSSLSNSQPIELPTDKVYGGIVNHHLTADKLIAEFFKSISFTQPDIVIVVGPNHTGSGVKTIHTSVWDWETPYGTLNVNRELVDYMVKDGLADINFDFMENEHSISSLVPYIKYFMPNSEIVPITLSSSVEKNAAIELGERLFDKIKDKNYIIISSVDFSHYLSLEEADKKDSVTKEVLLNRDINQISSMNNDYMDSPASIIFLLTIMNGAGVENQIILNQSNSARMLPGDSENTTSYFTVIYF